MAVGDERRSKDDRIEQQRYESLLTRAERIAEHRLDFFDLSDAHLGDPIVWNRDHKRGQDTPMIFSPALDYRDLNEAGDCKYVWEPNRHHQLVVLGRAHRASGDIRFANAVAEQLESWLEQNPYGLGMNWRSNLELGVRLINWVWALDLIKESRAIDDRLHVRLLDSVARHIWEIDRKYSRGSSVNNHLIGEAAGVFVATSHFANLKNASRWRARSRAILCREILNQTFPDGGTVEQAVGYHFFLLQFFVVAGLVVRATGQDMPEAYWSRLEKMFEFFGVLTEGGDGVPRFGDCDDGYVLDLDQDPHDIRPWFAAGAALYGRADFKAWAQGRTELIEWLPGKRGRQSLATVPEWQQKTITSTAFQDSGYYLLQHGELDSPGRVSVAFDCGPLGMGPLAAHGHADALSFTLRAFGTDVLVDPGTYDYFSYPKWRQYFRSTAAHNTVVIDGRDQSEILGPFLWGRRARARCLSWEPANTGGRVAGEHDGYTCLKDPVIHRRTLELDGPNRRLLVHDQIIAAANHQIEIYFHLAERCRVSRAGRNRYRINIGPGTVEMNLDARLNVEELKGCETARLKDCRQGPSLALGACPELAEGTPACAEPALSLSKGPNGADRVLGGWVSRGYHQKQASTTLVGRCVCEGATSFVCRIDIGDAKRALR